MPIDRCRACGRKFEGEPLLAYRNMPGCAQHLPTADDLESDKGVDLKVVQCNSCGLVQLSNDPVPYYREVIRATAFSEEMKDFRTKQFNGFVQRFSLKGKKVVEIGCGRGEYLSIMEGCGVEAYGLEHSDESVMQCVENGLKVSKGFIQDSTSNLNDAPFDAFFMLNFLEHLPDPNSALRGICNNLTDEAIGLIEVPNFDMILQNKLFSEFTCDHLFYFTGKTLQATLNLNGFDLLDCTEEWHDYILSAIVKRRGKLDVSHFTKYQTQLKIEIDRYISRFKNKQVAIWGAGHQALAIISLMNLAGKIKYVVDSAIFKQNRHTPATHLRIVSPDTLDSDPVDAVIIMAASYSDEVARTIRQKFDGNINISILRDYGLEVV